ncbi:MAG: sigma-70 family RNA polymerase sigma factor [Planctomycetes bacterium]|nr:sigma-70 family RNA polymerase sigma factor [Planctomycetota bacterium]
MSQPTKNLVESAVHGDPAALDVLLDRYLPGLEAFIRLRSGRLLLMKESSADLVQSVCREVLSDLKTVKYENEAHFKHWLYMAALRKIANRYEYYRAEKRDVGKEARISDRTNASRESKETQLLNAYRSVCTPSAQLMVREELARVEGAFEKLPEDYREVILLSRVIGLPHAEIAKKMERNEGAVRTLLSRALAKLSAILDDESQESQS